MWVVLTIALVSTLFALTYDEPTSGNLTPVYGFIAAVLCVSERAEATASKVFAWMVGTVFGGLLGLGLMSSTQMANNPYELAVLLCVAALAVGFLLGSTKFRLTITLTLMTLGAVVLCQHEGCCSSEGDVAYFLSRTISVISGIALAAAVSSLVLPWYTSSWALDEMSGAYRKALALVYSAFDKT